MFVKIRFFTDNMYPHQDNTVGLELGLVLDLGLRLRLMLGLRLGLIIVILRLN